jgi:hypothetical protein
MLTLSLFAACDKVLLDPIADQLSLIGVALRITGHADVDHPEGADQDVLDSNFVLPERNVAAFWLADPEDAGRIFEQKVSIIAQSDQKETVVCDPFTFTVKREYARTVQPTVIACRNPGTFRLVIYLRPQGTDDWGMPKGDFWFEALPPEVSESKLTFSKGSGILPSKR